MRIPADGRPVRHDPAPVDAAGVTLLDRVLRELDLPLDRGDSPPRGVPLPSRLATADLAWASVAAAMIAAGRSPASIDPDRVSIAYRSDRVLTIDGAAPPVWSPFSGFWRTADGWIRTHGNYPHHATALLTGLLLPTGAGAEAVRDAVAAHTTAEAVAVITTAGGLAVPVSAESPAADQALRERPLLRIRQPDGPGRPRGRASRTTAAPTDALPLYGFRVLDLTRVIAGPVCTRTLALLGADVLRIDPPHVPEPEWQHLDTGHGKRSSLVDARSIRFRELLAEADAVILGYRPSALARLGLQPDALAEQYPGLIVAQLSAWGTEEPDRAGFDSLVQAATGIALIESADGIRPGALPAQALDHSAGYLLAAAVTTLLARRSREGGSWYVETSLRRVAAELLGMPRRRDAGAEVELDPRPHLASFDVDGRTVVTSRPALAGFEFDAPHPWGADQPVW